MSFKTKLPRMARPRRLRKTSLRIPTNCNGYVRRNLKRNEVYERHPVTFFSRRLTRQPWRQPFSPPRRVVCQFSWRPSSRTSSFR